MKSFLVLAFALAALPAHAERMKVATTFTIIADMARNVAGDAADVESITKPGAEIHNYQPTSGDLIRTSDADLVLANGLNLESWFQQFIDQMGDIPVAVVSDGVEPMSITGGDYDGKPNPHAWMALDSALIYVDNIAAAMAGADPDNAAAYRANAEAYKARITDTIAPLRDAARALPQDRRWLVTSEGAFSYLARDFGLRELYLWPINADAQGTPQQVRHVIDVMRENDVRVIFSESTVSDRPARRVASETGAIYGGVLYVDSLSEASGPVPTYLDLLRVTSETIVDGLRNE
ncbi:ABC transporter substrate-binding protein [Paracoccus acridae]|uniref:ABC transporter substrate-binding protein n=1 Tax=Paracoccus acridae TaxID=1795310 RepID=A0ABQ1VFY9_9RHOB|nr:MULTISPECIES: metal ABC transporter substrate-binding protein [Paracoccus]GGF63764.1 ABC transporter substrate-binding protein [Paracoccus acridae]